ncbi:MAG: antitoxin [Thermodesulfobacteriota bacterium]|jgi:predicted DNA binding CopG/RHH family protein
MIDLDDEERELRESYDRGEWESVHDLVAEKARYTGYAREALRKDKRLNLRISSRDLEALQKRAVEEGLPYQTLAASILHKYVSGRLQERNG